MSFLLLLLIVLLAVAGGFLGDFLKLAAWVIGILAIIGAALGAFVYFGLKRLFSSD